MAPSRRARIGKPTKGRMVDVDDLDALDIASRPLIRPPAGEARAYILDMLGQLARLARDGGNAELAETLRRLARQTKAAA